MTLAPTAVKEPTISYQIVAALVEAIGGYPEDIKAGLRRFELDGLDSASARVPLRSFVDLFEWLARKMRRPYLGVELSERGGPQTVGAVGYLFLESRNLEAALNKALAKDPEDRFPSGLIFLEALRPGKDSRIIYLNAPRRQKAILKAGGLLNYTKLQRA